MRKIVYPFIFLLLVFTACREDPLESIDRENTADLFLYTEPGTASIFIDGIYTGKNTPDSIINLNSGNYDITFLLLGYQDTTVQLILEPGETRYIDIKMIELY